MITIIAAHSRNKVIGKDNKLIWSIPNDMKRFKEITTGNYVLMGRKTFESIGKPLPNRVNIVLTRDKNWSSDGVVVYNHYEELIEMYKNKNLFVIGGSEIYKQFLPYANKMELTIIDKDYDGDAYFPKIYENDWNIVCEIEQLSDDINYKFLSYIRK